MLAIIDWSGMAAALAAESPGFRVQAVKFMHDWLNMGVQKQKIEPSTSDKCSCCGQAGECGVNLFTCSSQEMRMSQQLVLRQFQDFMAPVHLAFGAGGAPCTAQGLAGGDGLGDSEILFFGQRGG